MNESETLSSKYIFLNRLLITTLWVASSSISVMADEATHAIIDRDFYNRVSEQSTSTAIRAINKRIHERPDQSVELLMFRGSLEAKNKATLQNAIKTYKNIINSKPNHMAAYNNLAIIYAENGELDIAIQTLSQGLIGNPSSAPLIKNLSTLQGRRMAIAIKKSSQSELNLPSLALDRVAPRVAPEDTKHLLAHERDVEEISGSSSLTRPAPSPALAVERPADSKSQDLSAPRKVASIHDTLNATLEQWAGHWSAGNAEQYLKFYASDFKLPNHHARRHDWENERRLRINPSLNIKVTLTNIIYEEVEDLRAIVTFTQIYRSAKLQSTTRKRMVLMKQSNDSWMILEESVIR